MKPKIAIVNSTSFGIKFPDHIERLKEFSEVKRINFPKDVSDFTIINELKDFDGIIAGLSPFYSRKILENLKKLKIISRHGIADSNIDMKAATELGICVCRYPLEIQRESIAEYTVALMLLLIRKLTQAEKYTKTGWWGRRIELVGFELKGKKVGIIGMGNVGSRVAEILKNGFNAIVLGFDDYLSEEEIRKRCAEPVSFEELIRTSDIITLHCSLTEKTYHFLNENTFSKMKDGVIIINTAEGKMIDENALFSALKSGKVGGFAADVVEGEPIGINSPLLKFKNVIILPHIGRYTYETIEKMGESTIKNMHDFFVKNKIPEYIENPDVIGKLKKNIT
ncbi:MAG: hydroxyacid dehydrogenase [Candidatus Omnitrophota bacterium]|nr:MAG: hydroxyacid dehydrogenase [Candidatus Omnitrophota bacterium]